MHEFCLFSLLTFYLFQSHQCIIIIICSRHENTLLLVPRGEEILEICMNTINNPINHAFRSQILDENMG